MAYEHRALTSESCLHTRLALACEKPRLVRQRRVEWATKPRAPTSIVRNEQRHSAEEIDPTNVKYRFFFRITAAGIPSSAPQVNSKSITCFALFDQMMMSGRSFVGIISGGGG